MPYIEVKESDLERLRELSGIFEIKEVVTKLIDEFLEGYTRPDPVHPTEEVKTFSFSEIPNLSHAKFIEGTFGNIAPNVSSWNGLMAQAIEVAAQKIGGVQELQKQTDINLVKGEKNDEGYKYIPSVDLSYQGVSATYAAKHVGVLGKLLKTPICIEFRWRNKDEAIYPGVAGKLIYEP